jgi:transcriptional regulator with XRE-family HTH domain
MSQDKSPGKDPSDLQLPPGQIAKLREAAGMSKAEFAKRMGVTPPAVANWEKGKGIYRDKLADLCKVFNLTEGQLLGTEPMCGRTLVGPECFTINKRETSFIVLDGDGTSVYPPDAINCRVERDPAELPQEVLDLRTEISLGQAANKAAGRKFHWDGPTYSLDHFVRGRTVPDEQPEVVFTFRPSGYHTFMATVMSLDRALPSGGTLREKYLRGKDFSEPIGFLAQNFGVVIVLFDKDGKILLVRRDDKLGARPGEMDVSVVESVHPSKDSAIDSPGPDLYRAAIRGASEELGIDWLLPKDVHFLGFGVDTEYYQWNMLGVARLSEPFERALHRRTRGTGGKWENKELITLEGNPREVCNFLKTVRIWSHGMVALYWALVWQHGRQKVERAFSDW